MVLVRPLAAVLAGLVRQVDARLRQGRVSGARHGATMLALGGLSIGPPLAAKPPTNASSRRTQPGPRRKRSTSGAHHSEDLVAIDAESPESACSPCTYVRIGRDTWDEFGIPSPPVASQPMGRNSRHDSQPLPDQASCQSSASHAVDRLCAVPIRSRTKVGCLVLTSARRGGTFSPAV
jgi:hypothetical protein